MGKDELEGAMADQAVDQVSDFLAELVKVMMEPEEAKKAEMGKQLKVEKLPAFLMSMEKLLKAQGGKYFAGSSLTWADIVVYQFVSSMKVPRPSQPKALIEDSDLTGCPAVSALVAMVGALPNIKKLEQTRPCREATPVSTSPSGASRQFKDQQHLWHRHHPKAPQPHQRVTPISTKYIKPNKASLLHCNQCSLLASD